MNEQGLNPKGLLVCVSGPSGVGKGTVIQAVRRQHSLLDHSVSVTTRPPRPGECEGIEYYFRSRQEFESMLERGEILEHDEYCGNYYGTPKGPIADKLAIGRDVIMDVTVPGSLMTLQAFPDALSIFLLPPSLSELERRLTNRGTEAADIIARRMSKAEEEILEAPKFRYIIVNHDVQGTAKLILNILEAERHLARNQRGIEQVILER